MPFDQFRGPDEPSGPRISREQLRSLLSRSEEILWSSGRPAVSRPWFDVTYSLAENAEEYDLMAAAAIGIGGLLLHQNRSAQSVARLEDQLSRSLSYVGHNGPLGMRLLARLRSERSYRTGSYEESLIQLEEARHAGSPTAWAECVNFAYQCLRGPGLRARRQGLPMELISAAIHTGRRGDLLLGLLWRAVDLTLAADMGAQRALAELRSELEHFPFPAIEFPLKAIEVMYSIRAGRFDEANSAAATNLALGHMVGDVNADAWSLSQSVAVRWYQGRISELAAVLDASCTSPMSDDIDVSHLSALALASAAGGDRKITATILARLSEDGWAALTRSESWLVAAYHLIEAADLLHNHQLAAGLYELLAPFAAYPLVSGPGVACHGSTEHALGVAALTVGFLDNAVGHFRAAITANIRLAHWPAAVMSRWRLAQALAARHASGDTFEAAQERARALEEAVRLGVSLSDGRPPKAREFVVHRKPDDIVFIRRGHDWEIILGDRVARVRKSVGLSYLATLVANPGHDIPALQLAVGPGLTNSGLVEGGALSNQPVLDDVARRKYRERLQELESEIEEFELLNDTGRAERARTEREWLLNELISTAGLGGTTRAFAGNSERARIAVGKAIRRALDRVSDADETIGRALASGVRTGMRCTYLPS